MDQSLIQKKRKPSQNYGGIRKVGYWIVFVFSLSMFLISIIWIIFLVTQIGSAETLNHALELLLKMLLGFPITVSGIALRLWADHIKFEIKFEKPKAVVIGQI